jgi:hypothetical protein
VKSKTGPSIITNRLQQAVVSPNDFWQGTSKDDSMESVDFRQGMWCASSEIGSGVALLLQAAILAAEVDREIWDFAVEISTMHFAGISNSDLRWMICKGYVQHSYEVTEPLETSRRFRASNELSFSNRSCFVLTAKGQRFARQLVPLNAAQSSDKRNHSDGNGASKVGTRNSESDIPLQIACPTWDSGRHQLRVADVIVKEYKLPSPNQETILSAFEEEQWPPCVADPLPVHPDLDPKRRLHDTIKSLNRNQRTFLIRFMGDGTGEGVRWEWVKRQPNV